MVTELIARLKEENIKWVDLRFCDTHGKEQHVTIPSRKVDEAFFEVGQPFDGSSVAGWLGIQASDMVLLPHADTAIMDPFANDPTMIIRCTIHYPISMEGYDRDPRSIAMRAEAYLKSTGIADSCFVGPEPEFFVFDDVRWGSDMSGCFVKVDSSEASWNTEKVYADGNMGHRPATKGGYFPVPPVDQLHEIRVSMCDYAEAMGLGIETHHHEVANAGQCELGIAGNTLVKKADEVLILKYAVHNTAHLYGKTATFMAKPIVGDNGSGMHVNMSLSKDGKNLFVGDGYGALSDTALYFIGGIIKHAKALNAFTNSGTNSYKRLVPGFEAPIMLAYSARNRSASIRIPYAPNPRTRRIECRFPDPMSNPYLAFASILMAGLDGIMNKIHPGEPADKDLYHLPAEEAKAIPQVCHSLDMALEELDKDRDFLTAGGVFTNDMIDAYIELKMKEVTRMRMTTHPIEFDMYYSR
ncbi:MAG: type I glutamate--ammonia ligase [Gammaproteobacteria bacterium]|nr:type I glutamate--ammonia ligase [Gammaproteobacteria bacterium]